MAGQTSVARHEDKWSFDMRALWRLAIWGTTASACLAAAVFAANTDVGAQRLLAMNAPAATPDIITPPPDQPSAAQLAARSAETNPRCTPLEKIGSKNPAASPTIANRFPHFSPTVFST